MPFTVTTSPGAAASDRVRTPQPPPRNPVIHGPRQRETPWPQPRSARWGRHCMAAELADGAQAVYMKGVAEELTGAELGQGLEVFDRVSRRDIGSAFGLDDVQGPALFRLYRATVSEHWVLVRGGDPDRGSGVD